MISNLWERTLYTVKVPFIIHPIYEYDISKANISILLDSGYIDYSRYQYYLNMEKKQRQIQIGYLQTYDSNVIKILDKGFANARQNLVMKNHIQDTEIVSIKKDAIFTTKVLEHVNFGNIHFSVKNKYDLFCHLNKLEIYFGISSENSYIFDLKGIRDDRLEKHQFGYNRFLCEIFNYIIFDKIEDAIKYTMSIIKEYDSRHLPIDFYREYNSQSMYRVNIGTIGSIFYIEYASINDISQIDISYNQNMNREIIKLLMMIYSTYRKHP